MTPSCHSEVLCCAVFCALDCAHGYCKGSLRNRPQQICVYIYILLRPLKRDLGTYRGSLYIHRPKYPCQEGMDQLVDSASEAMRKAMTNKQVQACLLLFLLLFFLWFFFFPCFFLLGS